MKMLTRRGINYAVNHNILTSRGTTWTPAKLPNLKGLYDARNLLSVGDGNPITTWEDKSGNGNDLTQSDAAKKPTLDAANGDINGEPAVVFDGGNDYMVTSAFAGGDISQPNTIFVVVKIDNVEDDGAFFFDGIDSAKRHALVSHETETPDEYQLYAGSSIIDHAVTKNAFTHLLAEFNGVSSKLYLNGTAILNGDGGSNVLSGLILGSAYNFVAVIDGYIAYAFVMDGLISDADRAKLDAWARKRFGIG